MLPFCQLPLSQETWEVKICVALTLNASFFFIFSSFFLLQAFRYDVLSPFLLSFFSLHSQMIHNDQLVINNRQTHLLVLPVQVDQKYFCFVLYLLRLMLRSRFFQNKQKDLKSKWHGVELGCCSCKEGV